MFVNREKNIYNKHGDKSYQTQIKLTVHDVHVSAARTFNYSSIHVLFTHILITMNVPFTLCCKLEEKPLYSTFLPDCLDHQEAYRCVAQILRLLAMMGQI